MPHWHIVLWASPEESQQSNEQQIASGAQELYSLWMQCMSVEMFGIHLADIKLQRGDAKFENYGMLKQER